MSITFQITPDDNHYLHGDLSITFSKEKNGDFFFKIEELIGVKPLIHTEFFLDKENIPTFSKYIKNIRTRISGVEPEGQKGQYQYSVDEELLINIIPPPAELCWDPCMEDENDTTTWFACLVCIFYSDGQAYCLTIPAEKIDNFLSFTEKMANLMTS
jgi:hypothetical protein